MKDYSFITGCQNLTSMLLGFNIKLLVKEVMDKRVAHLIG